MCLIFVGKGRQQDISIYYTSCCSIDGGEDSLKALIKARQASREEQLGGFFDSLEEKYCTKKQKSSGSKANSKSKKLSKSAGADGSGTSKTRSKSAGRQTKK